MKTKVRYCMSTVRIIIILYKGNFEKYKGKFLKLLFWNFKTLNLFKSCSNALVYIPEVMAHLLTPILPYLYNSYGKWQIGQIWHFWHFWHKWHIRHLINVMSTYGNMGVQRCVRTSGMQTNDINQHANWFNSLKCQNTELQNFPLYFSKFPL